MKVKNNFDFDSEFKDFDEDDLNREPTDEEILEIAIDVGADDVISDKNYHELFTSINEFNNVLEKLEKLLGMPEQAQIIWQPVRPTNFN